MPVNATPEKPSLPDVIVCDNIQELYDLTDYMDENDLTLKETTGKDIRKIIAEVRKARANGLEHMAQETLKSVTRTSGLRDIIDRIVQADSYLDMRK